MHNAWVVDASPIILYSRISRLDLINSLAPGVIVPEKVIDEIRIGIEKDNTAGDALSWSVRYQQTDLHVPSSVERWDLGPGESQVISFCLKNKYLAVIDDRMARRCISAHGLQVIGSLGIILKAKLHGLIDTARPWIYKLRDYGLYVDNDLVERALKSIGEMK